MVKKNEPLDKQKPLVDVEALGYKSKNHELSSDGLISLSVTERTLYSTSWSGTRPLKNEGLERLILPRGIFCVSHVPMRKAWSSVSVSQDSLVEVQSPVQKEAKATRRERTKLNNTLSGHDESQESFKIPSKTTRQPSPAHDVVWAMQPLYTLCRLLGLAPANWRDSTCKPSTMSIIFTCISMIFFATAYVTCCGYKLQRAIVVGNGMALCDVVEITALWVSALSAQLQAIGWNSRVEARVLSILSRTDESLAVSSSQIVAERRQCYHRLIMTYFPLYIICIFDIILWSHMKIHFLWFSRTFYVVIQVYPAVELRFTLLARLLAARFRSINNLLRPPTPSTETLLRLRGLYEDLCDCADALNDFGLIMLVDVAAMFLNLMNISYIAIFILYNPKEISKEEIPKFELIITLFQMMCWCTFRLILLFRLTEATSDVAKEAEHSAALSQKLLLIVPPGAPRGASEAHLLSFASTPHRRPVTFSAAGFFILDRPLVGAVIGTLVTYLVILIQIYSPKRSG